MRLRQYIFTVAVFGTAVLVALAFYLGQSGASDNHGRATDAASSYVDSLYQTPLMGAEEESNRRPASISIRSTPPGAMVIVESDSVGQTPVKRYRTHAGVVFLSLRKPDYAPIDTIVITEANQHLSASFNLAPDRGASRMARTNGPSSTLASADPLSSDQRTAYRGNALTAAPSSRASDLPSSGSSSQIGEATGAIRAISTPSGASFWVDGEYISPTPAVLPQVAPGIHRVTVQQTGYLPLHTTVELEAGATATVNASLKRSTGTLSVLVKPWATIYIDGQEHISDTDLQYTTQLSAGEHRLRIVHPDLGIWEGTIEIPPGGRRDTMIDLTQVDTQPAE